MYLFLNACISFKNDALVLVVRSDRQHSSKSQNSVSTPLKPCNAPYYARILPNVLQNCVDSIVENANVVVRCVHFALPVPRFRARISSRAISRVLCQVDAAVAEEVSQLSV